ncbi:tyrosine-type recombinase/integrase [Azorhizobium caulinodans]|uniref:tyrosine-type recombinase/integrase n=1 Tax=Azorhizobium caulinodans TaxID=7 RepID=UPI002FBEF6D9
MPIKPHTLAWGIEQYRKSVVWKQLATATRRQRENIYRAACEKSGATRLGDITAHTIVAARDKRADTPHQANVFVKAMRAFFQWAAGPGALVAADPTVGVKLLKGRNDKVGFHTWTEAECAKFEAHWPLGTMERLAFDVLLYTGLRRGDAARLGPAHVHDGIIAMRMEKTGETVTLPLLEPLKASIAATPCGQTTFIASAHGRSFVKESFGNWFRKACQAAGVPGSAHGLRKAGATRAAEAGATELELMALYGWTSAKQAGVYTRAANRRRLAISAAPKLVRAEKSDQ